MNRPQSFHPSPPGVQPHRDGRLVCLECGQTYIGLGHHVSRGHGLSPAEYRSRHQLPATAPLLAAAVRQRLANNARAQYPHNPRLREAGQRSAARGREAAAVARRESATRAGTRLALAERMTDRSARVRRETRHRYDAKAQTLGHADITALLIATTTWHDVDLAAALGVATSTATRIRTLYGPTPQEHTSRRAAQHRRAAAARHDEHARAAGYPNLASLLDAHPNATNAELAKLLGTSSSTAHRIRQAHRRGRDRHNEQATPACSTE